MPALRSVAVLAITRLLAGFVATSAAADVAPPHPSPTPAANAAARWCDTATIRYGRGLGWPQGSKDLSCRQIVDRGRALILRDVRPRGWRCSRWRASDGQLFGSCVRGKSFYGVGQPH